MYNFKGKVALITGGSSGIGKALPYECAARGWNLLLVALPGRALHEVAEDIHNKFPYLHIRILEIDLTRTEAPEMVYDWCLRNNYRVNILINNAGIAGTTRFEDSPLSYSDERIQLNIRALVLLTRLFIPELKQHENAGLLNVGSLSAFYSIPYKSIYSATKAFVVNFTRALKEELRKTSIKVSVVCPNGVITNADTSGRIAAHGVKGQLTQISAEKVAMISIRDLLLNKTLIIPGRINRGLLLFGRFIPVDIKQRILSREFEKELNVKILKKTSV